MYARELLGELLRLRGVRGLQRLERALGRGVRLRERVVRGLQLCELGVLRLAVLREVFGLGRELRGRALGLVFGELELLREGVDLELVAGYKGVLSARD